MVEMTVLHIASPFAFSAPVTEGQSSHSATDGQDDQKPDGGSVQSAPVGEPPASTRDSGIVDARDARLTVSRSVDLANPTSNVAATSGSLEAVLAAYEQDGAFADTSGEPADSASYFAPTRG